MENEKYFTSTSISTSAALLASEQVSFVKVEAPKYGGRRFLIFISPKEKAEKLFNQLCQGSLMINASKNIFWIGRLKSLVFDNSQGGSYGQ